jgi:2-keto-4-pentenoate hydratase
VEQALEDIATRLRAAADTQTLIAPPRHGVDGAGADAGYAVQAAAVAAWASGGRRRVGRKVALTSPAVQKALGMPAPALGVLFGDMLLASGATIPLASLNHARAEGEVALALKGALDWRAPTYIDVLSAVDYALPAIEIVDPRIRDWDFNAFDFIADNAAARLVVLGDTPFDIRQHDLSTLAMQMALGGVVRSSGSGAECMGSPLRALHWLASEASRRGDPLQAGEFVMTGALGPMEKITGGSRLEVRIGDFAPVVAVFS